MQLKYLHVFTSAVITNEACCYTGQVFFGALLFVLIFASVKIKYESDTAGI